MELREDLYALRGDIYAQDELLNSVYRSEAGYGAGIVLNNWDPNLGTWGNIELTQPGCAPVTINTFPNYNDQYPTDGNVPPPGGDVPLPPTDPTPPGGDQPPPPADGSDHAPRYRIVQLGDTLSGIAQDDINIAVNQGHDTGFNNDLNGYVQYIAQLNALSDPNTIYAGEELQLPPYLS